MIGILAAALIAGGAGGVHGLYDGLGAGFDYGFSIQLARSVPIGATAVDDGFRVTIDRAYLDGERLMLAVRVQDELERPEVGQLMAMYSVVTDEQGVWAGAGAATSRPLGPWVATNIQWLLTPGTLVAGTQRLHVEVPHISWYDASLSIPTGEDPTWDPWRRRSGAWSFDIDVPVDGPTDIRIQPDLAIELGDRPFRIEEVILGRSAVRLRFAYDDPGATWTLVGELRHDGTTYPFVVQSLGDAGFVNVQTDGGSDEPSGAWELVITQADRQFRDGPEQRFTGPWHVDLDVP